MVGPATDTSYSFDSNPKRKSVLKRRSFRTQQVNQHTFLCTASMAQNSVGQSNRSVTVKQGPNLAAVRHARYTTIACDTLGLR